MNRKQRYILYFFVVIILALVIAKLLKNSKKEDTQAGKPKGPVPVKIYLLQAQNLENNIKVNGSIHASNDVELRSEISGVVEKIYFKDGENVQKGKLLLKLKDADLQARLQKLEQQKALELHKVERSKQLAQVEAISKEELENSNFVLQAILADIKELQATIDKYHIRAPFAGKIGIRRISEGAYIGNTVLITTLQSTRPMLIDFSIPEAYAGKVHEKQSIQFSTSASNKVYSAQVQAIEGKIESNSRTLLVRAVYPNANNELISGAYANINLSLAENKNALLVPSEAIIPELKGYKIFTKENGKAVAHKIQIGLRTDRYTEVKDGLAAGDSVIASGILQLKPDVPVKAIGVINLKN